MLVLTADSWISAEAAPTGASGRSKLQDFGREDVPQGYFIAPKGKRDAADDDYLVPGGGSRKASGAVNITLPYRGAAVGTNFEVTALDGANFVSTCDRRLKVDQVQILEVGSQAAFSKAVQELLATRSPPQKFPRALDPYKGTTNAYDLDANWILTPWSPYADFLVDVAPDLNLKDMDLVSKYYKHNQLLQKMAENKCHGCVKLKEHMAQAKRMKMHREEVNALRFQMSDEALQQMPEFQGRVSFPNFIFSIQREAVSESMSRLLFC